MVPRWPVAVAVAVAVVVIGALWYLVSPPRSADGYRDRASNTAQTLRSEVQTTRIWLRTLARDDALRSSASVGLIEAEEDANSAASGFARYDPPRGTEPLRSDLLRLGERTTTVLGDIRIAAHRDNWARLAALGRPLPTLAERLDRLARRAAR